MTLRVLLGLIAFTASVRADAPHGALFRASPGFGYAWDRADTCAMAGRMFIGGFAIEYEVADGILVGGAATIVFNTLLADGPCGAEDGLRLAMGAVMGPAIEWYPAAGRGLQVFALAGFADLEPAEGEDTGAGEGVGATLGVGWDWRGDGKEVDTLWGVRLQLTYARTWSGPVEHAALTPALVMTFGVD